MRSDAEIEAFRARYGKNVFNETLDGQRVNVLCGCGYGLIGIRRKDVPHECPTCGRGIIQDGD